VTESERCYNAAVVLPGRSCTRSKAPGRMFPVGSGPMFAVDGHGAYVRDVEGRDYLDMLCGLGAISLGHEALPALVPLYSLPHRVEAEAAQAVLTDVAPWAGWSGRVKWTKTGSEATHAAMRIAKRETGRRFILMGDWAYHGWHEWCSKKADGTPEDERTIFYPHGADLGTVCAMAGVPPSHVAAVFVEPHRWEPVSVPWLQSVRDFCTRTGAVMVFDSMILGGRYALGGASEYFSVVPDLECYGKAIGNGAPIACVVGKAALMDAHAELVSGTYGGDTVALAAVLRTLEVYRTQPVIDTLWARGGQLRVGLRRLCESFPTLHAHAEGMPVHQRLRFETPGMGQRFSAFMAARGILQHPDCINVCFAHSREDMARVVEAAHECAAELAKEV
jgi:glutamate-1-semialdehyde aminotransferase